MTRIVLRKFGKWTVEEYDSPQGKSLVVSDGWITDYPSDRGDGRIAYDRPEGIPEGVKKYVASLIGRRKRGNPGGIAPPFYFDLAGMRTGPFETLQKAREGARKRLKMYGPGYAAEIRDNDNHYVELYQQKEKKNPEHTACICESWGGRRLMPDKPCPIHAADDEAQRIDAAMLAAEEREHV